MFEVNLNKELAKAWDSNPPDGDEWHTGLVASYLTNELEAFPDADVESLQTVTDWHSLPRDEKGWLRYYPCFYTKYNDNRNKIYFPISDFAEFGKFDVYRDDSKNTNTPGYSIKSKMKNGVIALSTLSTFTNSLRQGNSTDDSRNYGARGFQGAPPYLLKITIDSDGILTGIPLPADFRVVPGSSGFRIWKISLGKDYFSDASFEKYMDECTIAMGPDTPPVCGNEDQIGPFESDDRAWDVVFVCHSNQEISSLALFAPGGTFKNDAEWSIDAEWSARRIIHLAKALPNTGLTEEIKKWWSPGMRTTFVEVKPRDYDLFEEKILKEFFKMSLEELSDKRADIIRNFQGVTTMTHTDLQKEIFDLVIDKLQVVLTGAPGTGKTYMAQEVAAQLILGASIHNPEKIEEELKNAGKLEQYKFVQFHPGYDYSDFVEGIKPKVISGAADFSLEDGIFKIICMKAAEEYEKAEDKDKAPKFVMVIDEINRADLSRVFGELFFGLEKDYRGKEIHTQYDYLKRNKESDEFIEGFKPFVIPKNLYIIGTMNDIDRSVESLDFALRRRFGWCEVSWEESLSIVDKIIPAASNPDLNAVTKKIMTTVNKQIIKEAMELEDAFALGGAYFKDAGKKSWDELWRHSIKIILNEYLRGNRCDKKIEEIEEMWIGIVNDAVPGTYTIPAENAATQA